MTLFTSIVVYVLLWWLTLFAVLPWRVQPQSSRTRGHDAGAPERPMLVGKLLATTLISLVLFAIVYALIDNDVISFRRMSESLVQQRAH